MMHRLDRMMAIVDDLERMTGTDLATATATATGSTTKTTTEEEDEEEGIHIARHRGKKKDVWAETHTAAPAQEQTKRAPSSSKAEAT
jgi:hypothetical protein